MDQIKTKHTLTLDDRSFLKVTAVGDVISFDETQVNLAILQSDLTLTVNGNGLSVIKLSLETGEVSLKGDIDAVFYTDGGKSSGKKGLFSKSK